jgi:hypothetical protein
MANDTPTPTPLPLAALAGGGKGGGSPALTGRTLPAPCERKSSSDLVF